MFSKKNLFNIALFSIINIASAHCYQNDFFLITHTDKELPISVGQLTSLKVAYPNLYQRFDNNDEFSSEEKTEQRAQSLIQNGALKVSLPTPCGKVIEGYFFDRGQNTVLVTGPGLWKNAESLAYFSNWFTDYDLFILDPRWEDTNNFLHSAYNQFKTLKNLNLSKIFQTVLLELIEIQVDDVTAVLKWLNSYKDYDQKYAKGICYSSWMFIATQKKHQYSRPDLAFDKMILNSCGLSIEGFIDNIIANTKEALGTSPDAVHPGFVQQILGNSTIMSSLMKCARMIAPDFAITDYLSEITDTPLLFIHGQSDQLITYEDRFKTLWKSAQIAHKAAFITPFDHAANDMNAEIYKKVVDTFIATQSTDEFIIEVIS